MCSQAKCAEKRISGCASEERRAKSQERSVLTSQEPRAKCQAAKCVHNPTARMLCAENAESRHTVQGSAGTCLCQVCFKALLGQPGLA